MTAPAAASIEADLARRLRRARRIAVLGIGDELRREDRLGMLAAREVEALRLPDVRVFLAGVVPESFTGPIRRVRPDHVLLLDAAEFGARPGTARVLHPAEVGGSRFSTHAIPLPVVIAYLEETAQADVTLIGIQPDLRATAAGLTPAEEAGLLHLVASLQRVLAGRPAVRVGTYGKDRRSK